MIYWSLKIVLISPQVVFKETFSRWRNALKQYLKNGDQSFGYSLRLDMWLAEEIHSINPICHVLYLQRAKWGFQNKGKTNMFYTFAKFQLVCFWPAVFGNLITQTFTGFRELSKQFISLKITDCGIIFDQQNKSVIPLLFFFSFKSLTWHILPAFVLSWGIKTSSCDCKMSMRNCESTIHNLCYVLICCKACVCTCFS